MKAIPTRSAIIAAALAGAAAAGAAPRTNVLLIMPDDISMDEYSFYNANGPRTPNVDALARESLRLSDFHVAPTCSPSRAALMTGRCNDETGVWHTILGRYFLRRDEITMADVFKANGYDTGIFGKWHLGDNYPYRPKDRGFGKVVGIHGGGIAQQPDYWGNRNIPPTKLYVDDNLVDLADERVGIPGAFSTNFFTSRAIEYMQEEARESKPFFVYLPYNVAHQPNDMPPDARPGVDALTGTVENLDKNVGRILRFLDDSKLADRTLLVFILSDNGMASKFYRGGKTSPFDGGHRIPCLVRWKAGGYGGADGDGREIPSLTSEMDLLPTLMDILRLRDVADRPAAAPIEGRSIKPLLDGRSAARDPALADRTIVVDNQRLDRLVKYKQASVMRDEFDASGALAHKWRLVSVGTEAKDGSDWTFRVWGLYDLQSDVKQAHNLALQPEYSGILGSLKSDYEKWWTVVNARADEYGRYIIGSPAQVVTCLYAHDWHTNGDVPWDQAMVADAMQGEKMNGFHPVEFARAGSYIFDLRRWPREIAGETTLTSTLHTPIVEDQNSALTRGMSLPIHSARIRVWNADVVYADERKVVESDSGSVSFTLASIPAGPATVQTWFYDASGTELGGAYYVYVEPVMN